MVQADISTVYLWTHTEFIPHYKVGKCIRFAEKEIEEWLEKRRHEGRATLKYATLRHVIG